MWVTMLASFRFGGAEGRGGKAEPWGPLPALLLVRGAALGGRVVQAHVLLAGSPADGAQARGPAPTKLPLLGGLGGVTRLREVLPGRREKQRARQTGMAAAPTR